MSNPNPFDAYVSSHMLPSVGLVSSSGGGGEGQQLWGWDVATTHPPSIISPHASLFTSSSTSSAFYDCTAVPFASTAAGGVGGGGGGVCPFYPAGMEGEYPHARLGHIKREKDLPIGQTGLNIGHRTYFPMVRQNAPRCQVEGCKADLSSVKHYHRRHKVCEYHSKATVVVAGGLQQRFCQQCSRFHVLSEFDEAKRSCRKRLADHNRRRRKPHLLPSTSTTASDRSAPRSATFVEKKKETSPKPTKGTAAAKGIVTNNTTSYRTIFTSNQTNISMESPREYQQKASPLRNGSTLSLGRTEGTDKGSFGINAQYGAQGPWAVISDHSSNSLQQQQQEHITTSSSSGAVFPHNFLGCNSSDPSLTANGGGCDLAHEQNSLLHHGQDIFEMDHFK